MIREILSVWVIPNAVIAAANLLPIPTSDGPQVWLFVQQLGAARARSRIRNSTLDARRSLEEADSEFAKSEDQAEKIADEILARVRKDGP